ncbi:hypothetical protein [Nonomuraea gerenzanensis]|uniref:hypothetical protein n=1 Tax=Nonomuraea gerenzanensis TaxID=93944 RepID=UPI001CD95B03|nr:hypothetical protein [Nonomuraea gerenzanensis]UBU13485.1 hypothetical protein LCN96_00140 [Nonomuraea gerenzanensis]
MSSSPLSSAEIISIANAELTKASKGYSLSRHLQLATFVLGVGSILIPNTYTYIPALLALITQMSSWIYRHKAGQLHGVGDEGRMRGLLLDALGPTSEKLDLSNWLSRVSEKSREKAKSSVDPDYFASGTKVGAQRLCEHMQENAFWGKCLYKVTAARYTRITLWIAAIGVLSVLVAIPLTSSQNLVLARILVAVLASGAAVTQVSEILSWRSAETKIEILDRRLEKLATCSEDELKTRRLDALLAVYGDYCVATATAPPIPDFLYRRERARLNDLWKQRILQSP